MNKGRILSGGVCIEEVGLEMLPKGYFTEGLVLIRSTLKK